MLMQFVAGGELFDLIRQNKRLPPPSARFYTAEIVDVLAYLHEQGIVYRDLKPENVLLNSDGHIKLCDFGFARPVLQGTKAWTMCGTPEYIAPEVILSRGHGMAVDFWSLGVLVFEMVVGRPPFRSGNREQLFEQIVTGAVECPPQYFSAAARDLVQRLLVVEPRHRLGASGNGVADIYAHAFFAGVDWSRVRAKQLPPPHVPHKRPAYSFAPLPPPPDTDRSVAIDQYFTEF